MSRIPIAEIEAVQDRSGGLCEGCGWPALLVEFHHRQARQMGGSKVRPLDVAANLVRLHPRCHQWVHAHPAEARLCGLIVPSWADYTEVEVRRLPVRP